MIDVVHELRSQVSGAEIFSGLDPRVSFDPWSETTAEWPLTRIVCRNKEDIASVLRVAANANVPVTVCGGREDVWGRNSRSGAIALDLSAMTRVAYDPARRSVEIESGVTARTLLAALPDNIVVPTTVNSEVGVIGASFGGGYGLLCGSFGLTCDALLSAELVTAEARTLHVSANENTELYAALRGGGSGYGVVTSAVFATYDCAGVLAAQVTIPLERAIEALQTVQDLLDKYPRQLGILPLFMRAESSAPLLILSFVWNGTERDGQAALERLKAIEGMTLQGGDVVPFRDTLGDNTLWPWGRSWASDTRNLARLDKPVCQELISIAGEMPAHGGIIFLHDFHGQATLAPGDGSAFPLRQPHFVAGAIAGWSKEDSDQLVQEQKAWISSVRSRLAPLALPGGYMNFLSPEEGSRVHDAFASDAFELRLLKNRYDPHDLLKYATGRVPEA